MHAALRVAPDILEALQKSISKLTKSTLRHFGGFADGYAVVRKGRLIILGTEREGAILSAGVEILGLSNPKEIKR